jgi:large conductance mechanosensitive channel
MAGFLKEFREFAVKGNVVDMAIGIIIGAAFGKIVTSLVADVITPPLGYLIGGIDFTQMAIAFPAWQDGKPPVVLSYGKFIQTVFDFSIVAFAIFLLVKGINSLKRKQEAAPAAPAAPTRQEVLLEQIRDLLAKRS